MGLVEVNSDGREGQHTKGNGKKVKRDEEGSQAANC